MPVVLRKLFTTTNHIELGDQMVIDFKELGVFTATAQKIEKNGVRFLFDDSIIYCSMNKSATNKGGYNKSWLKNWLNVMFVNMFGQEYIGKVQEVSLPTYGQLFGHDGFAMNLEPDDDEQFELMKRRKNRICEDQGDLDWYWIQNATKPDISTAKFAIGSPYGGVSVGTANGRNGVRPTFLYVLN